jgi:hypothetical protein
VIPHDTCWSTRYSKRRGARHGGRVHTEAFRSLETCRALVMAGYKPYAQKLVGGKQMELISMPFVQDGVSRKGGGYSVTRDGEPWPPSEHRRQQLI